MNIKLKDLKALIYHAGMLHYRLFNLVDGCVNVDSLPLLWESEKTGDWLDIGGNKYDNYFVQEIQTNKANTLDILISSIPGVQGDKSNND